jgi:hypothetical protein
VSGDEPSTADLDDMFIVVEPTGIRYETQSGETWSATPGAKRETVAVAQAPLPRNAFSAECLRQARLVPAW